MTSSLDALLTFAITYALLVIKPGPNMAMMLTRTLRDGFWAGMMVSIGINLTSIMYFLLAIYALHLVAPHIDEFSTVLKAIGAAYLIYLGLRGLINAPKTRLEIKDGSDMGETKPLQNFMTGVMGTLANPFVILFYATLVPSIFGTNPITAPLAVGGILVILIIGLGLHTMEHALAHSVRALLMDSLLPVRINFAASIGFILIGLYMALSGLHLFEINLFK